jgi:hypothetical protein
MPVIMTEGIMAVHFQKKQPRRQFTPRTTVHTDRPERPTTVSFRDAIAKTEAGAELIQRLADQRQAQYEARIREDNILAAIADARAAAEAMYASFGKTNLFNFVYGRIATAVRSSSDRYTKISGLIRDSYTSPRAYLALASELGLDPERVEVPRLLLKTAAEIHAASSEMNG